MNDHLYEVEFFWSDDDEGFIAQAPDLPGCSAFGETRQEAAKEIEDAIVAWIKAAREAGNDVPEAAIRKPLEACSGKVSLRMPKELHFDLQRDAERQGVSLNTHMCYLLTKQHHTAHGMEQLVKNMTINTGSWTSKGGQIVAYQLCSATSASVSGGTHDQHSNQAIPIAGMIGVHENA